jgi:capsule polysaccharide export protein KpsE/RkpR
MKQSASSELEVVFHPEPRIAETPRERTIDRLRLLWDNRRLLFRFAAWGLAGGIVLAFLIPVQYESTVRLMPPDDKADSAFAMVGAALGGKLPGGLGSMAGDFLGIKSSGALFTGILGSRTVQDDLIAKFDLRKVYWMRYWETARKRLASKTTIAEDRKSGIITLTVTDHDPKRAAAMAEEYVAQLNNVVSRLSTSSARRERVFLEERLKQVQDDLESAEKDFANFASKNSTIDIKEQAKAMVGAAAALQGEIIATQAQLEGLKQIYTENNVRVRSLRAHLTELQSELDKVGGKDYSPGDPEKKEDSQYPSLRKLPVLGQTYADLYRRTKVQETIFEMLTQQFELAKVAEAKEIPNVKVLDDANNPERKSFPPRLLIMFLGGFLALATGVIWIVGSTAWEQVSPRTPGKILAQEVFNTLRKYRARAWSNGSSNGRKQSLKRGFREEDK